MTTITPAFTLPFVRDVEVCPYADNCRYSKVCEYSESSAPAVSTFRQIEGAAVSVGQAVVGSAMLVSGVAMSLTLFLIPVGLPLALLGVAMIGSAGDRVD